MDVLLTNDDGIDAPGLRASWESVRHALGLERIRMTVVAPDRQRSECGHSVTGGRELSVQQREPDWYAVDGTPVDCIRVALATIMPRPALVVSGINCGANLGVDLLSSGTFAAAREAALHGIPAIAISHYRRSDVVKSWDHTPRWLESTLCEFRDLLTTSDSESLLWNVNLPAIDPNCQPPRRERCPVDSCPMERRAKDNACKVAFVADFHGRPRAIGTDVDQCFSGSLTISEIVPRVC